MNIMKKSIMFGVGILLVLSLLGIIYAEKLDIEVKNSYIPGDEIKFKVVVYDDENNKIQGQVNYAIQDYYTKLMIKGSVDSGQEIVYNLPENARQGPWKISADYNGIIISRLFNVNDLEKAEIKLQGNLIVLKNIGNTIYDKKILIYIGQEVQTAQVLLEIGQTKEIRLTAPDGEYNIKVIEGNEEQTLKFNGIRLTGNVIGLERVSANNGFWQKNRIVVLFLGTLLLVVIVIAGSKAHEKYSK